VTGAISFLIGYAELDHSRIDGTVPKCSLHFRQIHVSTHHVRGEGVLLIGSQLRRTSGIQKHARGVWTIMELRASFAVLILRSKYGPKAEGFIHVHHLRMLSEIGKNYRIDPIKDLRPVCPNCHSVIHLESSPFTINQLKAMVTARSKATSPSRH
jgi:hypothetical protein